VHLLTFTGDIPAIADLMNHKGHQSYYGCRICECRGIRHRSGGMYFKGNACLFKKRVTESYQAKQETVSSIPIQISRYGTHLFTYIYIVWSSAKSYCIHLAVSWPFILCTR
jgi:hypothetical protein